MKHAAVHIALIAIVAAPIIARAELAPPPFDLDDQVGRSDAIVRGKLLADGNFKIEAVMYGPASIQQAAAIARLDAYSRLASVMESSDGKPIDVIVFAFKRGSDWQTWGDASVAGLDANAAYTCSDSTPGGFRSAPQFVRRAESREAFEQSVRQVITIRETVDAAAGKARGAARCSALADLVLKHNKSFRFVADAAAAALRPVDGDEQRELLERIRQAPATDVPTLLDLAGNVPLGASAFEAIAPLTEPWQPGPVRRAAIGALVRIDCEPANEKLARFLTILDPEVGLVLSSINTSEARPIQKY
jgi:hypothetical protein